MNLKEYFGAFTIIQKEKFVCYLLILITMVVFSPVLQNEFVSVDDQVYVTENSFVQMGITIKSITWAFETTYAGFWHPLTWLSLMVDVQLYGLNPAGFHFTNLLLHIANSLLVFFVFYKMTGALWRSAFVAALFALHPLHVESVAWVAERKDVLSTLFWMLTTLFYIRYVERPCANRYIWVVIFFIFGLMAKPMLVTLPFVLLLLDYWPLNRINIFQNINNKNIESSPDFSDTKTVTINYEKKSIKWLIFEKLPLFILSIFASGAAVWAQQQFGALTTMEYTSFLVRVGNALISYMKYILKMIWPHNLVFFYPLNLHLPTWQVVLAVFFLISITILVTYKIKRSPYYAVGWFWYIGTLVPVIGLISVGIFSMADRYTYVPLIGIFVIIAWGVPEMLSQFPYRKHLILIMALSVLICLSIATHVQISYWRNSFALYTHALTVTKDNIGVHYFMGNLYFKQGIFEKAVDQYRQALQIYPNFIDGRRRLGIALSNLDRQDEAIEQFFILLKSDPHNIDAHDALATALIRKGKYEEGINQYRYVVRNRPDDATGYYNLAYALALKGSVDNAVSIYLRAIQLKPDYAEAHNSLGVLLLKQHRDKEAVFHFQKALEINPEYVGSFYNLGVALLEEGSIREAIQKFQKAVDIRPDFASAHYRLGQAFLKEGNVQFAIRHFRETLRINPDYKDAQSSLENALKNQ